jgi:hypothetical protein
MSLRCRPTTGTSTCLEDLWCSHRRWATLQQEPIEPDPAEVPAPLLMGGDWEYGQPYRYVGAHRAVDEYELTRDLGKRASLLRLPGFVTGQLPVLNEDHGDRTLAEVYRGGESNG